ncbi:DUF2946 family protein [Pleomorphomonas diazotrophica]|nr:DUF2946 family protein [Pleomorphomonas diazotrophica]
MRRTGWQEGIRGLTRDVMRVLFVYALVMQALAPLAVARAEARSDLGSHHLVLCSAMADAAEPAEVPPTRVAHDCLSCCLGSVVATFVVPAEPPQPARFSLWLAPVAPTMLVRLESAGGPPPQRAPPGIV